MRRSIRMSPRSFDPSLPGEVFYCRRAGHGGSLSVRLGYDGFFCTIAGCKCKCVCRCCDNIHVIIVFSWLLFVSDEKPRTAKVVRGHFNHNLFLLISRKTLIAIVFRVGLSGVRNGFPESLGCRVKRRKAIGRHGQVEERDTACIGVLGRRRIGLIWLSDIGPVRFTNRGRY